jgi:TolA-binding protein
MYQRALSHSPAYQPALLGLADALWDTGDHAGASKRYAEVVDRFPAEAVPARAKERVTP